MNRTEHELELMRRYLEGVASLEETQELEALIVKDASVRQDFLRYTHLDSALAGVRRSQPSVGASHRSVWLSWRPLMAAAAGFVIAALIGAMMLSSLTLASRAAVVERALKVHAALLDRCYQMEVRGEGALPIKQESLLWTRGDRFWNQIQADGKSVAWGRGEAGGVWFALSRKEGARLASDEVPESLALACELRSLELESLLQTILADFDLRREPSSDGREVIHAERKTGRISKYRSALLEVDTPSGVLRRVELHREHQGRVVATISASLVESSLQDEASYTLEGHLDASAAIYDRESGRAKRAALIAEFLQLVRIRPLP
jgi:hypothetical protein